MLSMCLLPASVRAADYEIIKNSLNESGIEVTCCRICGYADLGRVPGGRASAYMTAGRIADSLRLGGSKCGFAYDETSNGISAHCEFDGGSVKMLIAPQSKFPSQNNRWYAVVDITQYAAAENINDIRDMLYGCLSGFGGLPSIRVCITGSERGYVGQRQRKSLIDKIIGCVGGKRVDSVEDGNLLSVCGYTECIPEYIDYNDAKVNLNAASRYNSLEDRTYFWIGTPVIDVEY